MDHHDYIVQYAIIYNTITPYICRSYGVYSALRISNNHCFGRDRFILHLNIFMLLRSKEDFERNLEETA